MEADVLNGEFHNIVYTKNSSHAKVCLKRETISFSLYEEIYRFAHRLIGTIMFSKFLIHGEQ